MDTKKLLFCNVKCNALWLESNDMLLDLIVSLCCVEALNGTLSEFPWTPGSQYSENVTL